MNFFGDLIRRTSCGTSVLAMLLLAASWGCATAPTPHADSDGDGILDVDDQCPMMPEDIDGFQDFDGCLDDDNDGDGFVDVIDGPPDGRFGACRDEPEDFDGIEDDDGCPEPDVNRDGVPDDAPP